MSGHTLYIYNRIHEYLRFDIEMGSVELVVVTQRHSVVDVIRQRDQFRPVPLHPEQSERSPSQSGELRLDPRPEVVRVRIALFELDFLLFHAIR